MCTPMSYAGSAPGGVREVKNMKISHASFLERGEKKEGRSSSGKHMMADDQEKEKNMKKVKTVWNGHQKVKTMKVSTASLEKMKNTEKHCNANNKKKMQFGEEEGKNWCIRDLKNRESTILSEKKSKEKLNKHFKEKMWAADSKERRILSGHNRVKSGEVSTAFFGKEKKGEKLNKTNNEEPHSNYASKVKNGKVTTVFSEEEKRKKRSNYTNTEKETAPITPAAKEKRMRPIKSTEMMMRHDKLNWRNVPSNVSKEKKMDTLSGSNYKKRKREEPHTLSKKEKKMCFTGSDKKSDNGMVQEKKISSVSKKNDRQPPLAFLKFMCYDFKEFLLIPPAVAPKLKNLTNHHVYLRDAEERCSKVRLSVVKDSLAFHQGWNIFVSDHMIKLGEFLLFEYNAGETFSVRVFGIDSHERLYFKKDLKRVEHGVGSGAAPQDKNNGNLINGQCKTKGTSPPCSKLKTLIVISDSGTSAHSENTVNLTASDADSTHHVALNTNKGPKRVQGCVDNLPVGECGIKSMLPTCSEGKACSEIIIVTDANPLTHENDDRVEHQLEVYDFDEDLIREQRRNSIPLDSITAVEKHQNHSKRNISQTFCKKYEAPAGFRCLEKWRKGIVNIQATLDGSVQFEPEDRQKTDCKLVDSYGLTGTNTVTEYFCSEGDHTHVPPVSTMPVKEPSSADGASKCRHGETKIGHSINEKGVAVQLETQWEQLEPVGSSVNSEWNNIPVSANAVVSGKYGAQGLDPVGPEGNYTFAKSMLTVPVEKPPSPDGISKCGSSRTEVNHNVDGKGPTVQLGTKMDQVEPLGSRIEVDHNVDGKGITVQLGTKMEQVEPLGSSVCRQSSNIAMYANHVVAHVSEHCFSRQEDRKSINCEIPESLLPMNHSLLKFSLQLCIPDTTQKWLGLPKPLSDAVKQKRQDGIAILLKDPMKRLWPVLYHEHPLFVGFTTGWDRFVAGNNLQTGDLCDFMEPDDDEPVYSVQFTKQRL